ncbi:unnamed protein product [Allacma fusca]|uniref:Uncharacterized protein n=1 Tax=Allacma fusca TaxID=39272 RepID=A0A8J2PES8_9HEXA|nr:unnamed protein product [Allacma fusca]
MGLILMPLFFADRTLINGPLHFDKWTSGSPDYRKTLYGISFYYIAHGMSLERVIWPCFQIHANHLIPLKRE